MEPMGEFPQDNPRSPEAGPAWPGIVRTLRPYFAVDLRSLAAMRIGLGVLILCDLLIRSRDLVAHYTDQGVTTGAFLVEQYGAGTYLSLHYWAGGRPALTAALFIVHALLALGLLVGFRSRLMALACYGLGASLLKRNPGLYTAGDAAVMFLLFWSMFLPIGARCSLDAATDPRDEDPPNEHCSVASAAILLQVLFTYWFAAGMKLHSTMWIDGTAVENALHRDWVVDSFGVWLRQFDSALPIFAYGSLLLELFGPFLVFLPRRICAGRLLAFVLFLTLHIGFALSFHFGIFQWQAFAGWIVFLPACFWDRVGTLTLGGPGRNIQCHYDADCGFCRKMLAIVRTAAMLPRTVVRRAQDDPAMLEEMRRENSWIVIDHAGRHHHRWEALAFTLRRGPITWIPGVIMSLPIVRAVGDRLYKWIANHRDLCGWMIVWLRWRPVRLRPTLAGSVIAFWVILYVFLLNVRTVFPLFRAMTPGVVTMPARMLQLDPYWAMFTSVNALDGWVVLPARLADGSEVDLLTGEPVRWDKPTMVSRRYGSMRWMKLTQSYAGSQNKATAMRWGPWAEHFAERWDRTHPPERRVVHVTVRYVQEVAEGEYGAPFLWADIDRRGAGD
ncbi:MAG: HTTM domain-containing protein [Phycisphaeraceae bacterium]|nr:HTTM domain-containing protein [Phycisphaeraceae bacterium]